jgi:hypothetical protein
VGGNRLQTRLHCDDELAHGPNDRFDIAIFGIVEPLAIVVLFQILEKKEQVGWKPIEFCHSLDLVLWSFFDLAVLVVSGHA